MSIKSEAIIIRNETAQGANTASRVGGNLVAIADDLIAKQNEINANTSKVGITTQQANDINANTSKVGITTQQATDIGTNNSKVGITTQQAAEITTNNSKVGITNQQASEITTNNSKVGITNQQASEITTNNSKVGVTVDQANDILANNVKVGISTQQADDINANTSKVGITTQQANDILANNSKVGITTQQAADIVANSSKDNQIETVGESVLTGDVLYLKDDSKYYKSSNLDVVKSKGILLIATEDIAIDTTGKLSKTGVHTDVLTGFDIGSLVFLGANGDYISELAAISLLPTNVVRMIGQINSLGKLDFTPDPTFIELA